jgi:predicted NBD/HSP70 family sugar kinase
VFAAAARGDKRASRVVAEEAVLIAKAVCAVVAVVDPELVVLGGGIGRNLDLLQDALVRRLHDVTPLRPAVVVSQLGDDVVLRGAIATALELARELVFEQRTGGT